MEKYILFFDICSSSEILEDLNSQDKLEKWKNFIIAVSKIIAKIKIDKPWLRNFLIKINVKEIIMKNHDKYEMISWLILLNLYKL